MISLHYPKFQESLTTQESDHPISKDTNKEEEQQRSGDLMTEQQPLLQRSHRTVKKPWRYIEEC